MNNTKNYLKEKQHIVFQVLKNSFKREKTSHAYIISGSKGSPILDTAIFMAQSLVCLNKDENNLACEECINCQKIKNNGYADFKMFSGDQLKTDVTLSIQEEFNKSAIENENVKVYLDESLKRFDTVFPAAGSSNSAIELTTDDFFTLSKAVAWIDVCKLPE